MEDPFMNFLESEAKKLPVKVVEGRLSWDETVDREAQAKEAEDMGMDRQPRLIDAIYLDRELSTSVTISKAEANLIRYHISQLDAEIVRLNKIKRLLEFLVIALASIAIASILRGFLHF
jgi:hypothetical protein